MREMLKVKTFFVGYALQLAAPPKPGNVIKNTSTAFPGVSMHKRLRRHWRG
jgi:hypothetical protein